MHKLILLFIITSIILINGCSHSKPEIIDSSMDKSRCSSYIKSVSAENNLLQIETNRPSQVCQNITKTMIAGDEIRICFHDHGDTKIRVNYVNDNKAQIEIIDTFEHMSFGYNEVTRERCIISVDKTEFRVE